MRHLANAIIVFVAACAGPAPTQTPPSAASELSVQYADARGVHATFAFEGTTFTAVASHTDSTSSAELRDSSGVAAATWQLDGNGQLSGAIDGEPFTMTADGLDAAADMLLDTPSGQALSALGTAASDPRVAAEVPDEAQADLDFLAVVTSPESDDGAETPAATGCTTHPRFRVVAWNYCGSGWYCESQTVCCYPTSGCRNSYSWRCC